MKVRTGAYLAEDDIVRFDDQSGRAQPGGEAGKVAAR
jgi:hypothetical protein